MKTELSNEQKLALVKKAINGMSMEEKGVAMDSAESWAWEEFIDTAMATTVL